MYLHNFGEPRRPLAATLASGRGQRLAADMRRFLQDARRELAAAFESDTYARRQREVAEPIEREQEQAMTELRERAQASGVAFELTPAGVVTVPLRSGEPMTPAQFARLPEPVRARYQAAIEELGPRIQEFLKRMRTRQRAARERLRALEREVALFAVGHLIDELKERYATSDTLVEWLSAVAEDVTEHRGQLQSSAQEGEAGAPASLLEAIGGAGDQPPLGRYEVNVFVAHEADGGAPVVFETNPTYPNLFGRVEHRGVLGGGFVTDHRMLRPGAVHRANGGYLMLPAAEVLAQPLVWQKLKEVLRTGRIRLENLAEQYALFPTATLTPDPIELDVKVVLVGSPLLYQLAYMLDEDVRKLFRVKAEFDWRVPFDEDGARGYASFLSAQVRRARLRHFDAGAVARVIEHGARLAEDREWLSTRFVEIAGLAAEASHWACEGRKRVGTLRARRGGDRAEGPALEPDRAAASGDGRRWHAAARLRRTSASGRSTDCRCADLGDYAFGRPVRITASAGPGRGALVIDRARDRAERSHPRQGLPDPQRLPAQALRFEHRIALQANLTFEQSYEQVEGDSAASAELYALLSEIADVPLRQDMAVTGSVNQHGELQAIGGVNEKIEGFYRACKLKGLTGRQGVIIPEANVRHLMLSHEVVESVRAGRFHVWSARTVNEGIELLTGIPAGRRDEHGRFPEGTLHARVEERLEQWAKIAEAERRTREQDEG